MVADMVKLKQSAIDTCFLIDLADKNPVALSSLRELHHHKYVVFAPPTVLQELAHIATQSKEHNPKVKALALSALQSLRAWKISMSDQIRDEILQALVLGKMKFG